MWRERQSISWIWPIFVIGVGCFVFYGVVLIGDLLPTPITISEAEGDPNLFSAERSRQSLLRLVKLGSKPVGSVQNEIEAPRIIEEEVRYAIGQSNPNQSISVHRQIGSGSHLLYGAFLYNDITNVIVQFDGTVGDHSLLINCHFDSESVGDGASDDGINCAVMLELIRVLSKSPQRFKHNLVFLFNGAEEVGLIGADSFLHHNSAKKIRAFINLEAAGAGGRPILFQSGPEHPWLLKYYAKHAVHPHGFIVGEELYQNDFIPASTDFTIFKYIGGIPGLDIAYYRNGYVYHTKHDKEEHIPLGSHQHMGDNMLALIRALGNAEELEDIEKHSEGQMVYYDYLGWFMISYSAEVGIAVNVILALIAICSIFLYFARLVNVSWLPFSARCEYEDEYELKPLNIKILLREFGITFGTRVLSLGLGGLLTAIVGLIIDTAAPLKMPWYSNTWLIFPLFWCPCLIGYAIFPYYMDKWRISKDRLTLSATTQMNVHSAQILLILIFFILTCMNIRSAAVFVIPILFWTIANFVIYLTPLYLKTQKWLWVYLIINIPGFVWNSYVTSLLYVFFLPIMGHLGQINADLYIAIVSIVFCVLTTSFLVPLMTLVRQGHRSFILLSVFSVVMIVLSLFTDIGHPYRSTRCDPRPQRYHLWHINQEHLNRDWETYGEECGYVIRNADLNVPETFPSEWRSFIKLPSDDYDLPDFVGSNDYWIPSVKPREPFPMNLTVKNKTCNPTTLECNVEFNFSAPSHTQITIKLHDDVSFVDYSFWNDLVPLYKSDEHWNRKVILYGFTRGNTHKGLTAKLKLYANRSIINLNEPLFDVKIIGYFNYNTSVSVSDYRNLLESFPDYTSVTASIVIDKSYVL